MFVLLTKYHSGDQIENIEIGGSCSMYGGDVHTGFSWGDLWESNNLKDPSIDGRIISEWIFEKCDGKATLDRSGSG